MTDYSIQHSLKSSLRKLPEVLYERGGADFHNDRVTDWLSGA